MSFFLRVRLMLGAPRNHEEVTTMTSHSLNRATVRGLQWSAKKGQLLRQIDPFYHHYIRIKGYRNGPGGSSSIGGAR
jgi:hypothetical protein